MKFPDHEFEMYLDRARIEKVAGFEYLLFAGYTLPVSSYAPNTIDLNMRSYSTWMFWLEAFDNAQREAVQKKLVALRVQKRLGGK
jgi:hypothetical protein